MLRPAVAARHGPIESAQDVPSIAAMFRKRLRRMVDSEAQKAQPDVAVVTQATIKACPGLAADKGCVTASSGTHLHPAILSIPPL